MKKFKQIYLDNINGNYTDYKTAVKRLTKKDLMEFIEHCNQEEGCKYYQIVKSLRIAFN